MSRRIAGEPLQYIRGRADFYGREFYVDHRVLIPRPETELLVERVLQIAPRGARIVDVGAGSGCIAVTLKLERDDLDVVAVDLSLGALAVAKRNRGGMIGISNAPCNSTRLHYSEIHDVFVVGNDSSRAFLQVREHEPRMALTPGPRGIEVIDRVFAQAGRARVVMEIGFGQEADARAAAEAHRFRVDEVLPDLAGIPRVVVSSPAW